MSHGNRSLWVVAAVLLGSSALVLGRVDPAQKCTTAKVKASAAAASSQLRCYAKAESSGGDADPKCLQKAESKLRASFAKAESKTVCLGDADTALAGISQCTAPLTGAISGDGRCAAKKLKAAGSATRAGIACVLKSADDAALQACFAKVEAKLRASLGKADQLGTCTGTGDEVGPLIGNCIVWLQPPTACADSGHPTCGGACPNGLTCRPFENFTDGASTATGCSCVDVANGPQCGGDVCSEDLQCPDPGFVCEQWTTGNPPTCDHSICQPAMTTPTTLPPDPDPSHVIQCGDFPTCGGPCPDGKRCQAVQALYQGFSFFAGCLCSDPTGPRCEASASDCDLNIMPFSHCADPSLTCLVTLDVPDARENAPICTEAHCGPGLPTTTSTSNTNTTTTTGPPTTSSTSTSTSTSSTTTTLPCVSTPSVSGCFQDLGNCTILDTCTGLTWESKGNVPGPHAVNDLYVWAGCCGDGCNTMCQPNEAASATCLAMAENGTDGCGTECPDGGGCFVERSGAKTTIFDWINRINAENYGGHNDWRVPTEAAWNPTGTRELESILTLPCNTPPCIDPIFGPTANGRYWSRTTNVDRLVEAWYLDFFTGGYSNLLKREPSFVRAVR